MSTFNDVNIERAFDEYDLGDVMTFGQYRQIVEYMGELADPTQYYWVTLDNFDGDTPEVMLANYHVEPYTTGNITIDELVRANIDMKSLGESLSKNGIFATDGRHCGYFEY